MFTDNSTFIVLYTTNLAETKSFYNSINATLIEEELNKIVYKIGSNELHFFDSNCIEFDDYELSKNSVRGQGLAIYIGTKNIIKTHKIVTKSITKLITKIKPNSWESNEFLFQDNNGYQFVCYEDLINY